MASRLRSVGSANAAAVGDYSLVLRADGTRQWAYRGKPLYRFYIDASFGDILGDGADDKWHAAKP